MTRALAFFLCSLLPALVPSALADDEDPDVPAAAPPAAAAPSIPATPPAPDWPQPDKFKRVLNLLREVQFCPSEAADTAREMHRKLLAIAEPATTGLDASWCKDALVGRQERADLVAAAKEILKESKVFFKSRGPEVGSMQLAVLEKYHGEYRQQVMDATGEGEEFSTWLDFQWTWKIDRRKLKKLDLHKILFDKGLAMPPTPCRDAYYALDQLWTEFMILTLQLEHLVKEAEKPKMGAGQAACKAADGEPPASRPITEPGPRKSASDSDVTGLGK